MLLLLEELSQEKNILQLFITQSKAIPLKTNALLLETSPYRELLVPYLHPLSPNVLEWLTSPYEKNTLYPHTLIHKSISGNVLRSKSESLIDMALYMKNIPYRYECSLTLDSITFFPDFTILHPKTLKLYYWEHFGMMDDLKYAKDAFSKLQVYNSHGYLPTVNLIITFETKENLLTSDLIEKILQHYFM